MSSQMSDLLNQAQGEDYNASSIEVLEGLEPVRKRPGMYIGGTDERALHHLVAEVLDNSMDEAVAGYANRIDVELHADYSITIRDNGRGIPIDPHPKFPDKSALEVILCTLHAGGKFSGKAYQTSGGLHGVGASVVNALSDRMIVQVARNKELYEQKFSRGLPLGPIQKIGAAPNRRGTNVTFHADPEIFGSLKFKPARLFKSMRSKAYLFSGVQIRWKSAIEDGDTPIEANFHFPGGLADYLSETLNGASTYAENPFAGTVDFQERFGVPGKVEWAINWTPSRDGFIQSYCNTVPTPEGGTHEAGFWAAVLKGIRAYGELTNNRKAKEITREDLITGGCALVSCFIREPEFGGQTKEKKMDPKPVTFINTFFFQFVNPKSIIVGLTSISLFIDTENNYLRDSIILTVLWFIMAVGSQTGWCLMGKYMRKFATSEKFIKNFNYSMSFLLIVCVIMFYV